MTLRNQASTAHHFKRLKHVYPRLEKLPTLGLRKCIITGMGHVGCLRVPTALLREAGIEPTNGLRIQLVGRQVLIRQGTRAGGQLPCPHTMSVILSGERSQLAFPSEAFSAVIGQGFVLLGSLDDLIRWAPELPLVPYLKPVKPAKLPASETPIALELNGLLSWKDCNSFQTNRLYASRSFIIDHAQWALGGFVAEDYLNVQRFSDATVITRGNEESAYTQLTTTSRNDRHDRVAMYVGPHIFDLGVKRAVRVLIFDHKLVIVDLAHPLAQACPPELVLPSYNRLNDLVRAHIDRSAMVSRPTPEAPVRDAAALPSPRASYNLVAGQRLQLQGGWLRKSGLTPGAKYQILASAECPGGLLVRPVAYGDYTVTTMSNEPKLYVPAKWASELQGASVDVVPRRSGILIVPRETAATQNGSRVRAAQPA